MKKLDTQHKCLSCEQSTGQDKGKLLNPFPKFIPYLSTTHQKQNYHGSRLFRVAEYILVNGDNFGLYQAVQQVPNSCKIYTMKFIEMC